MRHTEVTHVWHRMYRNVRCWDHCYSWCISSRYRPHGLSCHRSIDTVQLYCHVDHDLDNSCCYSAMYAWLSRYCKSLDDTNQRVHEHHLNGIYWLLLDASSHATDNARWLCVDLHKYPPLRYPFIQLNELEQWRMKTNFPIVLTRSTGFEPGFS